MRREPRTAATWPWGKLRKMENGEQFVGRAESNAAVEEDVQTIDEMIGPLGEVGDGASLTLPSLRKDSRRRTAGGELRLGTVQQHQTISRLVCLPGVGQFLTGKWLTF